MNKYKIIVACAIQILNFAAINSCFDPLADSPIVNFLPGHKSIPLKKLVTFAKHYDIKPLESLEWKQFEDIPEKIRYDIGRIEYNHLDGINKKYSRFCTSNKYEKWSMLSILGYIFPHDKKTIVSTNQLESYGEKENFFYSPRLVMPYLKFLRGMQGALIPDLLNMIWDISKINIPSFPYLCANSYKKGFCFNANETAIANIARIGNKVVLICEDYSIKIVNLRKNCSITTIKKNYLDDCCIKKMQKNYSELEKLIVTPHGVITAFGHDVNIFSWQGKLLHSKKINYCIGATTAINKDYLLVQEFEGNGKTLLNNKLIEEKEKMSLFDLDLLPNSFDNQDMFQKGSSYEEIEVIVHFDKKNKRLIGIDNYNTITIMDTSLYQEKKGKCLLYKKIAAPSGYSTNWVMVLAPLFIVGIFKTNNSINNDELVHFYDQSNGEMLYGFNIEGNIKSVKNYRYDILLCDHKDNITHFYPSLTYTNYVKESHHDFVELALLNLFKR